MPEPVNEKYPAAPSHLAKQWRLLGTIMQVGTSSPYVSYPYQQKLVNGSTCAQATPSTTTTSDSATQQQVMAFEQQTGIRGLDRLASGLTSGLLSSDTRAQLLQQMETPSADGEPHYLTGQEDLARMIDRSVASNAANGSSETPSTYLTDGDLTFIRKASGYNLVISNDEWTFVDDNGNAPPDGVDLKAAMSLADQMDMDRQHGTLTGSVTKDYVEKVFARAQQAGAPYDEDFQKKVLSLFGSDDQSNSTSESNTQKTTDTSR